MYKYRMYVSINADSGMTLRTRNFILQGDRGETGLPGERGAAGPKGDVVSEYDAINMHTYMYMYMYMYVLMNGE